MRLALVRQSTGPQGTLSRGSLDIRESGPEWDFLELPWHGNAPNISCIPAGSYHAAMLYSARFGRALYHLTDVPGRTLIEIHNLNWCGDVALGWHSDSDGCLGIGQEVGTLTPVGDNARPQLALLYSRLALQDFHNATQGQPLDVEVLWMTGISPER